jgi:outer membrane receptor protein involved in Fe transport
MYSGDIMNNSKLGLLASVALVSSLVFSGAAQAQIDEIIVTATKRQQTLQETPVTVSVTTQDVLEKAQILDIADLQSVVPSLRVGQLQTSANTNFRIRGFGNGANNAGIEPSVGVFIDGVYRSRSAAQIGDLPKLERIEVLSGPQSTLFGKNASAGVINVVSAKPSYEREGYIEIGAGNYDQRILRAYATNALSDTMAFSVGGTYNKRDGYAESALPGLKANNSRDRWGIRGQLLFQPVDELSIRLIADYNRIDGEICCHVTNTINGPTAGAIQALGGQLANPADPFAYINYQNIDSVNDVKDGGLSLHVDYDFGNHTLTTISAYRSNRSQFLADVDFTTARILNNASDTDIKTFTQEIRLATNGGDNTVDWMLGGYYFDESITQESNLDFLDQSNAFFNILAGGAIGNILEPLFGAAPGSFLGEDTLINEVFTQENQAFSIFGNVDFHVTDKFTITGGLNYTKDKKQVSGFTNNNEPFAAIDLFNDPTVLGVTLPTVLFGQNFTGATGLAPTPANIAFIESVAPGTSAAINAGVTTAIQGIQGLQFQPQFLAFPNSVEDTRSNDDQVTWSVRAAFEVNDNINVYANAATGFKSSSWNLSRDSLPLPSDAAALVAAGLTQPNQKFQSRFASPEDALVYEIGLKARFSRGAFNIALFDQEIKGFQNNTFLGTGFVLINAGKQTTKGVEFDATYSPVDPLTFTFAGIYLDAQYDSFVNGPGPNSTIVDLSGQDVAGVPEFGFSTSVTYNHDFGGGTTGFIRGDYQYESEVDIVEVLGVKADTSNFNGSLGFELDNGFAMQVWGRNIFNHESFISAFPGVAQTGTINAYPVAPATYGVLLRKNF